MENAEQVTGLSFFPKVEGRPLDKNFFYFIMEAGGKKWSEVEKVQENQMFTGEYHHTIDKKNRLIIPSVLRQQIKRGEDRFVITRGLEKSLFLYTLSEWQNLGDRLRSLSTTKSNARAFLRLLFSGAHPVQPDTQGRITLPQTLKDFAQIKEKVTVIGAFNKIEIWSEESWNKYYREQRSIFEELSEKIMDMEI